MDVVEFKNVKDRESLSECMHTKFKSTLTTVMDVGRNLVVILYLFVIDLSILTLAVSRRFDDWLTTACSFVHVL